MHLKRRGNSLPYPPTPPGHFLLGNLRDVTAPQQRYHYDELAKRYGEIFHLSALGEHIVVVNSEEAAYELFTRRSAIYSDRPQPPMIKLMGWDINLAMMTYGEKWRAYRRLFHQGLNPHTVASFQPVQSDKLSRYLQKLLVTPQDLVAHADMLIGSIVFKVVYGRETPEDITEDKAFLNAVKAMQNLANSILPGEWLVNSVPILQFLPQWFPGCRFHSFARETRALVHAMVEEPYEQAKERLESAGQHTVISVLDESIAAGGHKNITPQYPKEVCGTVFAAAGETTLTVISTFYLIMRQHPDVQDKAYREIGEVIGQDRLPEFNDRASLPYVEAVYREVMRWMPALPYSVPHSTTQDDVYNGYFIPKGTSVIPNIWSMVNDEVKYPNPRKFMPERYLSPEGKFTGGDINSIIAFGFGRRICVGRYLADASVWRLIACVLAAFRIEPQTKNDDIEKLENLDEAFLHTLMAHSIPYECAIAPRSPEIAEVIREMNENA